MYESTEDGQVQENDLAAILEIMLGVKEVELSCLFLSLDNPDVETITYGEMPSDSAAFPLDFTLIMSWKGNNSRLSTFSRWTCQFHRATPSLCSGLPRF